MREMCLPRQQLIAEEWWRHWSSKWTILAPMDCHCPRSWWGLGLQLCYQMPNSQRWLHWRKSTWLLYNKHIVPWTSSPSLVVQSLPITQKSFIVNTLNTLVYEGIHNVAPYLLLSHWITFKYIKNVESKIELFQTWISGIIPLPYVVAIMAMALNIPKMRSSEFPVRE